jgi:hypothetical protein
MAKLNILMHDLMRTLTVGLFNLLSSYQAVVPRNVHATPVIPSSDKIVLIIEAKERGAEREGALESRVDSFNELNKVEN